jgi:hypothetical protein
MAEEDARQGVPDPVARQNRTSTPAVSVAAQSAQAKGEFTASIGLLVADFLQELVPRIATGQAAAHG